MTLHQVLLYDAPEDTPPVLVDFEGTPMVGDTVYLIRDEVEVAYYVEVRFWHRITEPIAGHIVTNPGASTAMRRHHKLFLGLRPDPRTAPAAQRRDS